MKNIKLSDILSFANTKRAIALMLALAMLVLAGCNKDKTNTTSKDNTSSGSSQAQTASDTETDEGTEDEGSDDTYTPGTSTSSYIDPLKGEISVDPVVTKETARKDTGETYVIDPSNLCYKYKGYAQKERDKLLDEILNTPNTLKYYTPKKGAKVYYVSPSGSNTADGLSPESALMTVDGVYSLDLKPGDFVLFERDSVYRLGGRFYLAEGVTYGSYGTGKKPMFLGSPRNFAKDVWKPSNKKNVWFISYMNTFPCGMFLNDGEEFGYLKLTLRALEKNTDFYYDEEGARLYLYCDKGNPGKVWNSIEVSQSEMAFYLGTGIDNVTIDNIAMRYMGDGGVYSNYNNNGWCVTNCEIGFSGGTQMGSVRGGNGVGTWCGGQYLYWDHNWVYHTFDNGMSPQGNAGRKLFGDYHDISHSNNLFEYNNADIEIWESHKDNHCRFYNYYMNNNICRFTSLGWGTRKDDGGIRGIDGVHYGHLRANQITGPFQFNNNIIDCPGRMLYKFENGNKAVYDAFERKGNTYYIKQSMKTDISICRNFHWPDESGHSGTLTARTEEETKRVINLIEPDVKAVYWYK